MTGYWGDGAPEEIKAAGGYYEDMEVVVDGIWPLRGHHPIFPRSCAR
ncbi:MAG: hypothetical protein HY673_23830 [Chloroflexi bacterium]|nr:hypothetical protein [Chloroflexota bacterium]